MREYLTTQVKLSKALGISPEYFSMLKKYHTASNDLLQKLEKLTGIQQILWASPSRSRSLKVALKEFFTKERSEAKKANRSQL